eukprot:Gregarina_sp_Poly_1__4921@NODE_260_length_10473_cov_240_642802_g227_i0_p2_GENE_NODE_260_length_10473_cov_240_642802_g227_i0NODE_260_length_10473_cov_240_642802_g227_i0_p2_ORF_typecomplete_len665_score124_89RFC1/PF08519_12/3_4e30AAA/PF00004_29/7_4e14Rad17/PF03215_15/8_9e14RuvB_N/PF05496_12/2_1e08AAA_2/PF07724_14/3_3e06AAA_5/PF07728_14/3_7e06BRCT/PF00533_26/1_2e05AAA_6/PF12774_7/6_9e05AAA_22/PF13401_6/0_002AAA_33/PF13671_6/0_0031AAA_3/PF07726_11/0_0018NTPase_1/PF03266_15/0_05AAA_14/PF13173_6/0_002
MPIKRAKRDLRGLGNDDDSPPTSPARKVAKKATASEGGVLAGLKIVVSGVPESLTREHLEAHLRSAGAQITSAVSGITNVLLLGKVLEDSRPVVEGSKYKKAQELLATGKSKGNLKIYREAEFYAEFPSLAPKTEITSADLEVLEPGGGDHYLWAEKWRPKSPKDFAFNLDAYRSLEHWASHWSATQETDKGALLAGPPGVGKTSAVIALAETLGYNLIEFNASDTRGQKQLKQLNALITGGASLSKGNVSEKLLILMDEADGLSSGDRGGAQELVKMIKLSRVPIICTCNDKQHAKVRTLAKSCRVIDFKKCDKVSAVKRAQQIAHKEGYAVNESFVSSVYEAADGDMRQLLNGMQSALMARPVASGTLQNFVLKDPNANEDAFSAVKRLFASEGISWRRRLDAFFVDYDLVPLIVHENYLKLLGKNPKGTAIAREVSDSLCYGDILNSKIRAQSQWDLLPDFGFFSTVYPTMLVRGIPFRIDFPKFLGRISSTNKHRRQLSEIAAHTGKAGRRLVSDGYYEALGDELIGVLKEQSLEIQGRIDEFLENIAAYGLTKDLVLENLLETRYTRNTGSPYDKVETKTKSALTRAWNAAGQPGQITKETKKAKKSGKKKASTRSVQSTPAKKKDPDDTEEEEEFSSAENLEVVKEKEEEERKMGGIC